MLREKIYDTFEGPRKAVYKESCVVCHSSLYVWEGSESSGDPRGAIKEKNNYNPLVASEYNMEGPDVPACFVCMNEQERYDLALKKAKAIWKESEG